MMVSTSADKMGDHTTGAWSEEITGPYYTFKDADCDVMICSIDGGDIPIDAGSLTDQFKTENDKKMEAEGSGPLKGTQTLASFDPASFDIVFFCGGHGTCVDFPTEEVGAAVSKAAAAGKVIAAVCHGPMALVKGTAADGKPLVAGACRRADHYRPNEGSTSSPPLTYSLAHSRCAPPVACALPPPGKSMACFTDVEEGQVGLTEKVPFLLEAKMKELGATVKGGEPWSDTAVADGKLVTGQNPQSSVSCAKLALAALKAEDAPAAEEAAPSAAATDDDAATPADEAAPPAGEDDAEKKEEEVEKDPKQKKKEEAERKKQEKKEEAERKKQEKKEAAEKKKQEKEEAAAKKKQEKDEAAAKKKQEKEDAAAAKK